MVSWYQASNDLLVLRRNDCDPLATSIQPPILHRIPLRLHLPEGTIMTTSSRMMPTIRHMRIFISFHHICLRTRLAPLRKPWADTARLSVLSCSESRRAPRSDTLLMLSRMIPTVLSISCRASQYRQGRPLGCRSATSVGSDGSDGSDGGYHRCQRRLQDCRDVPLGGLQCGGCRSGPGRLAGRRRRP